MADIVDQKTRSRMMARISGKNTRPEMALRRALHARGVRYRLHDSNLPGSPDLVFSRYRAICFVHGCFWHRHSGCPYATDPATRPKFWQEKFKTNVERDHRTRKALLEAGWRVAVVWECAVRGARVNGAAQEIYQWLQSDNNEFETGLE